MRIFIAFDIPDHIKERILQLEKGLRLITSHIRFVNKENMHITIKFMGELPYDAVKRVSEILTLQAQCYSRFSVSLNRLGVFKSFENPRVLWLGEDNKYFKEISNSVNSRLYVFRPYDNEPFCHLTIGRMKYIPRDELREVLKIGREFVLKNRLVFSVSEFYLYESKLFRNGAIYKKLEKFILKEN